MRSLLVVCALLLVASVACAATPGQVPDATLASFGLSGMQQMTDAQGTSIRGMGSYHTSAFVAVSGSGTANFLGSTETTSYLGAGSANNASGNNIAAAGVIVGGVIHNGQLVSGTIVIGSVAVGGSSVSVGGGH